MRAVTDCYYISSISACINIMSEWLFIYLYAWLFIISLSVAEMFITMAHDIVLYNNCIYWPYLRLALESGTVLVGEGQGKSAALGQQIGCRSKECKTWSACRMASGYLLTKGSGKNTNLLIVSVFVGSYMPGGGKDYSFISSYVHTD